MNAMPPPLIAPRPTPDARPGRELRQPFPPVGKKAMARLARRLPNFRLFCRQARQSKAESVAARKKVEDARRRDAVEREGEVMVVRAVLDRINDIEATIARIEAEVQDRSSPVYLSAIQSLESRRVMLREELNEDGR